MFDLVALTDAVAQHRTVARIVIASHIGSAPRETGTAMLVWADGQSGTIGGGALEWQAVQRARDMLPTGGARLDKEPLGPKLGQCCGGAVTLLTEVYGPQNLPVPHEGLIARSVGAQQTPLAVKRIFANARGMGAIVPAQLTQGWFIEPVAQTKRDLWIWGAGHVGRALVSVLVGLPNFDITWVDVAPDRFPDISADALRLLAVPSPAVAVQLAPKTAEHLILTYSHALDLELCHQLLGHGFSHCGLIGSQTKWARFKSRLLQLGHARASIHQITCPIGDPSLGKHPQQIAIGVAASMINTKRATQKQESVG